MAGVTTLKAERAQDPVLVFRPDGTWGGSDGCNGLQGTYTIGPHRLIGCDNVPNSGVLRDAKRLAVDSTTLQFFAADGRELAKYVRAG